jgi:hypothetical protein
VKVGIVPGGEESTRKRGIAQHCLQHRHEKQGETCSCPSVSHFISPINGERPLDEE